MSLGALASLPEEERRVLLDQLLERLPPWLQLIDSNALQPRFLDARFDETWRLFTGGTFEMGATAARLNRFYELHARYPLRMGFEMLHSPPRTLSLRPFLMMEQVIRDELDPSEPKVVISEHAEESRALLEQRGARLPTEAQWEFAWRAVQRQPGHWVAREFELCADGWTTDLTALTDVDPLVPGGPAVLRTATFDLEAFENVLPSRQPLTGIRMATVRGVLDVPTL